MSDRRYFVYIMTSSSLSAMYIGVTNDVGRRVVEHRSGWKRIRKNELIRAANPKWEDLIPEHPSSSPFEVP
jgi:putative endonuclease